MIKTKMIRDEMLSIVDSMLAEFFDELRNSVKTDLRGELQPYFLPVFRALQQVGRDKEIEENFRLLFEENSSMELLLLYPEVAKAAPPEIESFKAWFRAFERSINKEGHWYIQDMNGIFIYLIHVLHSPNIASWFFNEISLMIILGGNPRNFAYKFLLAVADSFTIPEQLQETVKEIFETNLRLRYERESWTNDTFSYMLHNDRIHIDLLVLRLFPGIYSPFVFNVTGFEEDFEKAVIKSGNTMLLLPYFDEVHLSRENHEHLYRSLLRILMKINLESRVYSEIWQHNQLAIEDHLYWTLSFYRENCSLTYKPLIDLFEYLFGDSEIPPVIARGLLESNANEYGFHECDLALVLSYYKKREILPHLKERVTASLENFPKMPFTLKIMTLDYLRQREGLPQNILDEILKMIYTVTDGRLNELLYAIEDMYKGKELPGQIIKPLMNLPDTGVTGTIKASIFCGTITLVDDTAFNKWVTDVMLKSIREYFYESFQFVRLRDIKSFLSFLIRTDNHDAVYQLKQIINDAIFAIDAGSMVELNPRLLFIAHLLDDNTIAAFPESLRAGIISALENQRLLSVYNGSKQFVEAMSLQNAFYRKLLKSPDEMIRYLVIHLKLLDKIDRGFFRKIAPLSPDPNLLIIQKDKRWSTQPNLHGSREVTTDLFGKCMLLYRSELAQIS